MRFPMEAGPVEIVDEAGAVVGRGFAENGPEPDRQRQWWLLYRGYRPPPLDPSSWRRPASAEDRNLDFVTWRTRYARGAAPEGAYYCVATAVASEEKPEAGEAPPVADDAPRDEQIDYGSMQLVGEGPLGYVFVPEEQPSQNQKTEHWLFTGGAGAASAGPMRFEKTPERHETNRDVASRIGALWTEGSTYVVCACTYSTQSF